MAYTTEYKRRRRIARSIGNPDQQIKGSRIEHAAAQESRAINAQVAAGTYVNRTQRFAPTPRRLHFAPDSMPTYEEMQAGAPVPFAFMTSQHP